MKKVLSFFILIFSFRVCAQTGDIEQRIKKLEEVLINQSNIISEQRKEIEELKAEIEALKHQSQKEATNNAVSSSPEKIELKPTGLFGSSNLMNPNISVVVDTSAYTSNLNKKELGERFLPGFDFPPPQGNELYNKGFHFNYAELYLYAPVDPYFNLYTTIPFSENGSEVEEAYFLTSSLPKGLQFKGGKFKSAFGRLNSQHEHTWDFSDAPLPYRAFLGEEGLTDTGLQINYVPQTQFYLDIGGELFQGSNEMLFGKEAKNGPHCYTLFAKTSFDCGTNSTILTGLSLIKGEARNWSVNSDSQFTGKSSLYDFEFTYKWKKSKYKGFTLQSEYLYRKQNGDVEGKEFGGYLNRHQDGFYIQGVYLFGNGRWRIGSRYDRLNLFSDSYKLNEENLYFGKDPYRISFMAEYNPTEFSRIRFQYNHDKSYRFQKTNREFILQLIFGIGAHAAHSF
ncbi:MAG: hypothetical protein ACE14Q_02840 [Acidobacteriota bacterium]